MLGNPFANLPKPSPPLPFRLYAPNGDTMEAKGWLGLKNESDKKEIELVLVKPDNSFVVLNKKVIVVNKITEAVVYNPRLAMTTINGREFIPRRVLRWLQENPQWPAILELEDNPVEGDTNDGLSEK